MSAAAGTIKSVAAVELTELGRRYGASYVLQNVNLTVSAGKTLVLKGSNGAGKTTLLRVLSTRLRPSRGGGRVFGFDLVREAHRVRERVAYMSVFGGSYGGLTPLENLSLATQLYGRALPTSALETRLEQVGLGGARHKLVRSFSSGMKKRLAIARLLLSEADLWLLDEPYAALDEQGKGLIDGLLTAVKTQGKTVVLASHELERSARFADRVLELRGGGLTALPIVEPVVETVVETWETPGV